MEHPLASEYSRCQISCVKMTSVWWLTRWWPWPWLGHCRHSSTICCSSYTAAHQQPTLLYWTKPFQELSRSVNINTETRIICTVYFIWMWTEQNQTILLYALPRTHVVEWEKLCDDNRSIGMMVNADDDDDDGDDAIWLALYSIHGSNQVWDQLQATCSSFPQSPSSPSEWPSTTLSMRNIQMIIIAVNISSNISSTFPQWLIVQPTF